MKNICSAILCVLFLFAGLASAQDATERIEKKQGDEKVTVDSGQLFWIFLTTGKTTEGVSDERIQEMQAAHLANFKALAERDKLLTAGPLTDPEKKLRGIVVARAKNERELMSYFDEDPYVQNGYLKIEATKMKFEHGVINTKITPQGLEEYRIVILENNGGEHKESEDERAKNRAFMDQLSADKNVLLSAILPSGKFNRHAVLVMSKNENDEALKQLIAEIPAVKSGLWKTRVFPLYMGKGTLTSS